MTVVRMSGRFTVEFGEPTPPPSGPAGVYTVRKWNDPVLRDLGGWSYEQVQVENFQAVMLFTTKGGFDAITQFQRLGAEYGAYYNFLKSLQREQGGQYGGIDQIMNFLVNHDADTGPKKRPYWNKDGEFCFGTIVFGGQKVQVETHPDGTPVASYFTAAYPNRTQTEMIKFYKLVGMRKNQMGLVTHQTHPWLIQRATAVDKNENYIEFPRGVEHLSPVWDDRDWPSNNGPLYLAAKFLEV